jgi:hypothetical protein
MSEIDAIPVTTEAELGKKIEKELAQIERELISNSLNTQEGINGYRQWREIDANGNNAKK